MLVRAVTTSGNKKLGNASTTLASQASCPTTCPFLNAGCYAERGPLGFFQLMPMNLHAAKVGASALDVARAEAKAIDEMATVVDRPLRLHTVGDCSSDEAAQIVSEAAERYMERGGGPVWTYTHAWRDVRRESWGAVSVLASCETPMDVELARSRGYATAIVVESFEQERLYDHDGTDILPCPNLTRGVKCSECRLCFSDGDVYERGYSIGFSIHGDHATRKRARAALGKEMAKA